MKRLVRDGDVLESVECMSQIKRKFAKDDIKDLIPEFIYFSQSNSSHGPRIKFWGGDSNNRTYNQPSVKFGVDSNTEFERESWMTRKNCPNAFDSNTVRKVKQFVDINKPLLLLVWFRKIDENDVLVYLMGTATLKDILNDNGIYLDSYCMESLDKYCIENNLYSF